MLPLIEGGGMLGAGKLRAHASLTTTPGARATKGLSGREGYSASERVQLLFKKLVLGDKVRNLFNVSESCQEDGARPDN